ncbi:hypothetical protein OAV21_05080 [bacterium]|jgi:hypothetical protein|nr:hypothetical protein [Verrucomicrobiales bacterium]MDC3255742.1 hypothetical protein [bacterium]MDF1784617.1 hypothetical protein [Verrucomicrobiales bacterium]
MGPQEDQFRTTFPIPAKDVAEEMLLRIYWSPATWISLVSATAVAMMSRSRIGALVAGATAAAGLLIYWASQWRRLKKTAQYNAVTKQNDRQNDALHQQADELSHQRCKEEASTLRRFIDLKITMEKAIVRCRDFTPKIQKTKTLIDTICFEVTDQLQRLAENKTLLRQPGNQLTEEERQALEDQQTRQQDQIDSAYRALTDMQLQLETMLAPHEPFTVANNRLAETIAQVQEEAEIARRVRQRIEADNVAAILSEPTATETNGTITPEVTEEDS